MLNRPPWRRRLPLLRCPHTPLQSVETLAPAVSSQALSSSLSNNNNSVGEHSVTTPSPSSNDYKGITNQDHTAQWLFQALLLRSQLESNTFFLTSENTRSDPKNKNESDADVRLRQLMAATEQIIYSPSLTTSVEGGEKAGKKSTKTKKNKSKSKKGDKRHHHTSSTSATRSEVAQQQEEQLIAPLQTALVDLVLLQAQTILPLTVKGNKKHKKSQRHEFFSSSFATQTELVVRLIAARHDRETHKSFQLLLSLLPHHTRLPIYGQQKTDVSIMAGRESARRALQVALTLDRVLGTLEDGASCLPLLLYRRAQGSHDKPLKRWLSLAADCLCAMPSQALLAELTLAAPPLTLARESSKDISPTLAVPFGEFAAVLSAENHAVPLPSSAPGAMTTSTSTTTNVDSCFSAYARMALQEMVACGGAALQRAAAAATEADSTTAASSCAVGAYLACRRCMGALPKHQRLRPLLELYQLVMGPSTADVEVEMGHTPQQWRAAVLGGADGASALLWREMVLFDAYTLISVGHVSTGAVDLPATEEALAPLTAVVRRIQGACQQHLQVLQWSEDEEKKKVVSPVLQGLLADLTPNTRQDLVQRLQEGLRLSTKYLLRIRATEAIRLLYRTCPEMGGSWEVGQALLRYGDARGALAVLGSFLAATRQTFAGAGLPARIQDLLLETLRAVGREYHAKVREVATTSAPESVEARLQQEIVSPLLKEQENMHALLAPLRPALCFDALLQGLLDTDKQQQCGREQLYTAASVLLSYFQTRASLDGLLVSSVDALTQALLTYVGAHTSTSAAATATTKATTEEEAVLEVLSTIGGACPHLPVAQHALSRFTQARYERGVRATLTQVLLPAADGSHFTPLYIQHLLVVLPVKVLQLLRSFLHPDGHSHRHRARTANELYQEQYMVDMVEAALRTREENDAQQLPWMCFLCQTWNSRFATQCKLCRSKRIAVVQCSSCSGLSTTDKGACRVCGVSFLASPEAMAAHTTAGTGGAASALDRSKVRAVFPLRPWTCRGCHHANDAEHALLCHNCGAPSSAEVSTLLKETAYTCTTCGHHNGLGALRPWCAQCGALSPATTAAAQAPTATAPFLWQCVQCFHLSPSFSSRCEVCGGAQPVPAEDEEAAAPLLSLPWQSQHCPACGTAQSLNATLCRQCGRTLEGLSPSQQQHLAELCHVWLARVRVASPPTAAAAAATVPSSEDSCVYCQAPKAAQHDGCCSGCGAYPPGTALWMCLLPTCGGLNYEAPTANKTTEEEGEEERGFPSSSPVCCVHCGTARTAVAAVTTYSDVLGYRPPPSETTEEERKEGEREEAVVAPRALLLPPPPIGPRHCASCGEAFSLPLEVCTHCGHVGASQESAATITTTTTTTLMERKQATVHNGWRNLQGRLLLSFLETELRRFAATPSSTTSSTTSPPPRDKQLSLALPDTSALLHFTDGVLHYLSALPEADLPWRGCDVHTAAHLCGAMPRLAVLADEEETVHSAVVQMREVVERLCDMAAMHTYNNNNNNNNKDDNFYSSAVWLEHRRPWLALAVRAVRLVNETTDYDELGWPALSRLCTLVRCPPGTEEATAVAITELRWTYLEHMKLPVAAIVRRPQQRRELKATTDNSNKNNKNKKRKRNKKAHQEKKETSFLLCPNCLRALDNTVGDNKDNSAQHKCSCGYTWPPEGEEKSETQSSS